MPSISFTQLEVQKRTGNSYELIMNFDITPTPDPKNPSVNLQYAVYDEHNQIIDTMVLGKRSYTIGSNVYPHFITNSKNVRVEAWLTGNTLVRTYDIFTTTGAKEFNKISNIASNTLSLLPFIDTIGTGFQRGQAYQAPVTQPAAVTVTEPLLPEISFLPEAHAEHVPPEPVEVWPTLSQETKKIINDFPANLKAPDWALTYISNNINWLLEGKITETVFLTGYYDYVKKGTIILIDEPEPIVDQVTTNMIRQELLNFTIVNNRIQGSIKFIATNAFNPYFYNKPITNYLQLKSEGFPIESPTNPKSNRLTFTETARDEIITFDEDAQNLTFVNAESFIEPGMAEVLTFTIEAGKEATTTKTGFMGAGVLGLIGILMLGGFIADHARRKR